MTSSRDNTGFARGEVVAPTGLWERGAEASGYIPPSARLLPAGSPSPTSTSRYGCFRDAPGAPRAPKAHATPPSGGTHPGGPQDVSGRSPLDIHASSVSIYTQVVFHPNLSGLVTLPLLSPPHIATRNAKRTRNHAAMPFGGRQANSCRVSASPGAAKSRWAVM